MITYVNTVLVGHGANAVLTAAPAAQSTNTASSDANKFVVETIDNTKFRVGIVTKKNSIIRKKDGSVEYQPIVKWSNDIKKADIKSFTKTTYAADTEDKIEIDFTGVDVEAMTVNGAVRLVVRLTFKDLPTRYRKWSESYEVMVNASDDASAIATKLANKINSEYKRARVTATAASGVLTLEAMPYDDDNSVDTINVANKVRFSANMWYTDPQAAGFASKNKYSVTGATIEKTPGKAYAASAKLVRDMEAQAMGYLGILNRGECTWPIIKPAMETELDAHYDSLTLEFENLYRTADDLQRRTKQTLQVFDYTGTLAALITAIQTASGVTAVQELA